MSKPDTWMPLYVAKYLADTTLFTTELHGAYLLLLFSGWMNGGDLPDDDDQLAAATKMTPAAWRKARPVLVTKFTVEGGVWRQKRLSDELTKARTMYSAAVENGKKGGRPRKSETQRKPAGSENHNPAETQPITQRKHNNKDTPSEFRETASLLSGKPDDQPMDAKALKLRELRAASVRVITFLNAKTGRNYKPDGPNVEMVVSLLKNGSNEDEIRQVIVRKSRQWQGDAKMDEYVRPKTLFNRTNFAQYQGELVAAPGAQGTAP